jgi:hypothetical protein
MPRLSFTLSFEGLCAFADRADEVEVYLLPGHDDHMANLIMRADFLNVDDTTWTPTAIGFIQERDQVGAVTPRQVAMWSLHSEDLRIADTAATGRPHWLNKHDLIDFALEHKTSTTLTKAEIQQKNGRVGVVTLTGRGSVLEPPRPTLDDNFVLKKPGHPDKHGSFSRLVRWTPTRDVLPTITNRDGKVIAFRETDTLEAWATISNVAPVSATEGLTHFHHYYDGVTLDPTDEPLTIESGFVFVWDCVPTAAWL